MKKSFKFRMETNKAKFRMFLLQITGCPNIRQSVSESVNQSVNIISIRWLINHFYLGFWILTFYPSDLNKKNFKGSSTIYLSPSLPSFLLEIFSLIGGICRRTLTRKIAMPNLLQIFLNKKYIFLILILYSGTAF